jgi:hypothetical protein
MVRRERSERTVTDAVCEAHFTRHRKRDRREGMTTHFQFTSLESPVVSGPALAQDDPYTFL